MEYLPCVAVAYQAYAAAGTGLPQVNALLLAYTRTNSSTLGWFSV